jgi:hypothetical protein
MKQEAFHSSDGHLLVLSLLSVVSIELLQVSQCCTWVQSLGASERAKTDLIALSKFHVTAEHLKALLCVLVSRVDDPSVGLHEHSRSQVVLRMPPVAGASRLAACAQDALVQTVQEFSILNRLCVLHINVLLLRLSLQEWLDLLVLGIEVRHVDDEVLEHEHEHEWGDHTLLIVVLGHTTKTGQVMTTIDVHGAGTADALTARSAEGKSRVDLVLDLDQGVQEHGSAIVHINVVGHVFGTILGVAWVASIDVDPLHVFLLLIGQTLVKLLCVVDLENVTDIGEAGGGFDSGDVAAAENSRGGTSKHQVSESSLATDSALRGSES